MGKLKTYGRIQTWFWATLIMLAIIVAVYFGISLQMEAYHQRFPDAEWWTFFFQGNSR